MRRKILVVLLVLVLVAGFAYQCYVRDKPVMAVAISSCSMEPLMRRGDVVFIRPVQSNTNFHVNQIILFKSEKYGIDRWIIHRIVGGCASEGFITKGDNNCSTDQIGLDFPRVMPEWIGGQVLNIGSKPLKIPALGYVTLMVDENLNACPCIVGMAINITFVAIFGLVYWLFRRIKRHFIRRHDIIRLWIKRYFNNRKKVNA